MTKIPEDLRGFRAALRQTAKAIIDYAHAYAEQYERGGPTDAVRWPGDELAQQLRQLRNGGRPKLDELLERIANDQAISTTPIYNWRCEDGRLRQLNTKRARPNKAYDDSYLAGIKYAFYTCDQYGKRMADPLARQAIEEALDHLREKRCKTSRTD